MISRGSSGTTPTGHIGPTAFGSWSVTSTPPGPRTLGCKPSPRPQPPQCNTWVLPVFLATIARTIGADGSPVSGVADAARRTAATLGAVGWFAQPDSRRTAAISNGIEQRRI